MKITGKLWMGLFILVVLSPLGLIVPAYYKSNTAWGEWGAEEIKNLVGYIPKGFKALSGLWKAPMSEYSFNGWEDKGLPHLSLSYFLSAVIGVSVIFLVVFLVGKFFAKKDK